MNSSTLWVLFLALASSIIDTALEATSDHGRHNQSIMRTILHNHREMYASIDQHWPIGTALGAARQHDFSSKLPGRKSYTRVKRQDMDERCDGFLFNRKEQKQIVHPSAKVGQMYERGVDCVTVINGTEGQVIMLTFVDMFHIEDHPECAYDFLEIRDGDKGFAKSIGRFCGQTFPNQIRSTGPNLWLKFHSDDTIEYEGFHINIDIVAGASYSIPDSCQITKSGTHGLVDTADISQDCLTGSSSQALDVLWIIKTDDNTKIHLNFTTYQLEKPNECEDNFVEVFGSILEVPKRLAHYCGSMANPVTTKGDAENKDQGNIMYVRLYASKSAKKSVFNATFTAYRTLDPIKEEKCRADEFDCEDYTCIHWLLRCDNYAHCRLKTDEDSELCKGQTASVISEPHIMSILIIFSLIISGMSFVFLYKCISKLYKDHKIIKEHIKQSTEDRFGSLVATRLTLDAKKLERDSEPRASLERENITNEMYKRQRNFSQHKPTSIDSDFVQETQLDLDDEPWRRDVENISLPPEDVRVERNGRQRRSDTSKREEAIRKDSRSIRDAVIDEDVRERKEIRDASVGAPDTKESGCQTRESLFQSDAPSPAGTDSGSDSRGFSTFGYSGATLKRPSPPAATATSQITIELLKGVPPKQDSQSKKFLDRRPMSAETTRSAPDVIIVSKPVR